MSGQDSYFTLPNQSMPEYFDFTLHFHNMVLDYYTIEDGKNIQIRWSEGKEDGKPEHTLSVRDEQGAYEYTLGKEQERELCETNVTIREILTEGEIIFEDVYE